MQDRTGRAPKHAGAGITCNVSFADRQPSNPAVGLAYRTAPERHTCTAIPKLVAVPGRIADAAQITKSHLGQILLLNQAHATQNMVIG